MRPEFNGQYRTGELVNPKSMTYRHGDVLPRCELLILKLGLALCMEVEIVNWGSYTVEHDTLHVAHNAGLIP